MFLYWLILILLVFWNDDICIYDNGLIMFVMLYCVWDNGMCKNKIWEYEGEWWGCKIIVLLYMMLVL